MTCDDVIHPQLRSSSVERLPPEHSAKGAVVLLAYLVDNLVHRPAIELVVGENLEREAVFNLVLLDRLSVSLRAKIRLR